MKRFLLPLIAFITLSCQSKEDSLKERMRPVITKSIIQDSLVTKVDSLIIYKIDTLTDLEYNKRKINSLFARHNYYRTTINHHEEMAKIYQSMARTSLEQSKLYGDYLNDSYLSKSEALKAKSDVDKSLEEVKNMELYSDSATIMLNQITEIQNKIKAGRIDSLRFKGYIPRFRVIGANNKGVETKLDSMYIYLSENMNIIPVKI